VNREENVPNQRTVKNLYRTEAVDRGVGEVRIAAPDVGPPTMASIIHTLIRERCVGNVQGGA
jgi:hypothetical protein